MTDFIVKMQLVAVDLRKLKYYLKLITMAKIITEDNELLGSIANETIELLAIATKSIATAKTKIDKQISGRTGILHSIHR